MPPSSPPSLAPATDPFAGFRLDGRVVLITGTSSGIGVRFGRILHAAGAQVVMAARRLDRLDALAAELPGSVAVQADVSSPEECARLVERVTSQFGRVDVLVNNAGTVANFVPKTSRMTNGGESWRSTSTPPSSCRKHVPTRRCSPTVA